MKTLIKSFLILTVVLLFSGCEKKVDIKIRDVDMVPKLVVSSFIAPQDTIVTVVVSKSVPLYSPFSQWRIEMVPTAKVIISDGINTKQLAYNFSKQKYSISAKIFPISPGVSYQLTVDVPDFQTVSATTTVPLENNNTLRVDSQTVVDEFGSNEVVVKAKWQDKANETNYYQVVYIGKQFNKNGSSVDTVLSQFAMHAVNDVNRDGSLLEVREEVALKNKKINYGYDACEVYLFNASKDYYELHKSLEAYQDNDPFTEASPVFSNIKNGLGVFAGYNGYKVQLK